MLTTVLALAYMPLGPPAGAALRVAPVRAMASDEVSMMQAMSDSFWKQKRARLQAELAAQLAELDEFEARERALQEVTAGPSIAPSGDAAALMAALEAERAKSAALEAQLAKTIADSEINLQKVAAFWVAKLAEAKDPAALPAAAAATEPAPAPAADIKFVDVPPEFLEDDLSVRELRARLLSYGLSTLGLKSELRARLEGAMKMARFQYKAWDSEAMQWK